jgi:hypothetical protein
MATNAVSAQVASDSIVEAWWFRFLVRTALALLAFWALSFAADRYTSFVRDFVELHQSNNSLWLSWIGATVAVGLLFGLATWLPFTKVRFLPSRLLLAAAALVPIAQSWWVLVQGHGMGGWLGWIYLWFDGLETQFVLAALGGVAIASGFKAKGSRPAPK